MNGQNTGPPAKRTVLFLARGHAHVKNPLFRLHCGQSKLCQPEMNQSPVFTSSANLLKQLFSSGRVVSQAFNTVKITYAELTGFVRRGSEYAFMLNSLILTTGN